MRFDLTTRWSIPAERERVFAAIAEPADWIEWWPGVLSAREDDPGDENGVGRSGEIVWRAPLGYRVRFELSARRIDPPRLLEATARGDLSGVGTWALEPAGGGSTDVTFHWRVEVNKLLMRAGGPLVRRILIWNHDRLMRRGEHGLARHLSQDRPSSPAQNTSVDPPI